MTADLMDWTRLFSSKRLGKPRPSLTLHAKSEGRSEFQRDFDRVIFSSAFRRLQSKTQVVPLPENDFVHTRLTHSLEASCVGRSLGRIVGNRVISSAPETFDELGVTASDFESVVAAACLAHDIGNPPFGHSGEDAISEYFKSATAAPFLHGLTEKQVTDLQNFEGNAAGFRLLTHTSPSQSELKTGLGLTFATLGAFTKYPKESLPDLGKSAKASERKFGFFQSEKQTFEQIAAELGLIDKGKDDDLLWRRHPLSFLVEAADDICYTVIDLEDGFKLDRVPYQTVAELLKAIIGHEFEKIETRFQKILDPRERVSYLRANAINTLSWQSSNAFTERLPQIMTGKFDEHLTDCIAARETLNEITRLSIEKIYRSPQIVEVEAAGFEVLAGLLDAFLRAVFDSDSKHSKVIRHLIPARYLDTAREPFADKYSNIINMAELVAGMTDSHAIETYRRLKGISLPRY